MSAVTVKATSRYGRQIKRKYPNDEANKRTCQNVSNKKRVKEALPLSCGQGDVNMDDKTTDKHICDLNTTNVNDDVESTIKPVIRKTKGRRKVQTRRYPAAPKLGKKGTKRAEQKSSSKGRKGELHVCEKCNKAFSTLTKLTMHGYSHTGEKPFK